MTTFNYSYEISGTGAFEGKEITSNIQVEGDTEEHARAFAEHSLEENFPGDEGWQLLSLELVSTI
jgi:hypothetical protein